MHIRIAVLSSVLALIGGSSAAAMPLSHNESPCPSVHAHSVLLRKTVRYYVGGHGGDFHALPTKKSNLHKLGLMRACWKENYPAAYHVERRSWERAKRTWTEYHHLDQITRCGEWVVCGVVENESATSGYYHAYNPPPHGCSGHGCVGAYQIDQQWFTSLSCRGLFAIRWTAAGQHECAYIILRVQGLGAWAGDGAYL